MPDFALETDLAGTLGRARAVVLGVDESGRGPWAGPVVAAAVWLDPSRVPEALLARLDECKAVPPPRRLALHDAILECAGDGAAALGVGLATVAEIDALNILQASLTAMGRAVERLAEASGLVPDGALVDGPHAPVLACRAHPVVGGDTRSASIAAASIVAKVTRDRHMAALARRYPGYGWERNQGYGTAEHQAALARLGVSPEHRRSFRPVREILGVINP